MGLTYAMMGAAAKDPRLTGVFTQFRINSPQLQVDIDRNKAKAIGISLNDIFQTMEVDLGSLYVNNFTYLNRSWQVDVQGDAPFRNNVASLQQIYVHSGSAATNIPTGTNPFATPPPGAATTQTTATGRRHDAAQRADEREDAAGAAGHHALQPVPQHRAAGQRRTRAAAPARRSRRWNSSRSRSCPTA